jgi:Bacterial Ig domain/Kelch motif
MDSLVKVLRIKMRIAGTASLLGFIAFLSAINASAQAQGTFAPIGSLPSPQRNAASTLLPSGIVLIVGGIDASSRLTSLVIFDPISETFSSIENMDASYDTATLLTDGEVLLAGRGNFVSMGPNDSILTTAQLYDPSDSSLASTGPMLEGVNSAASVRLPDGRVLLVGGRIYNQDATPTANAEIYDPTSGTFSFTGTMTTPRYNHTATLLQNGEVLVAGGSSSSVTGAPLASAELYNPTTGAFSPAVNMTTAHANHTATILADGRVLIAGGSNRVSDAKNGVTAVAEIYDPSTNTFTATGLLQTPREFHTATRLNNGDVLVAGGDDSSNVLNSTELYAPASGTFTFADPMSMPREELTATLLGSGSVLVAGGLTGFTEGAITDKAELYSPTSASPAVKLTAPATGAVVSGTVSILAQVTCDVSWINIYIDGSYFASSPPYTFSWDSATVANGVHTISTRAFASGGTQVGSDSISVSVTN